MSWSASSRSPRSATRWMFSRMTSCVSSICFWIAAVCSRASKGGEEGSVSSASSRGASRSGEEMAASGPRKEGAVAPWRCLPGGRHQTGWSTSHPGGYKGRTECAGSDAGQLCDAGGRTRARGEGRLTGADLRLGDDDVGNTRRGGTTGEGGSAPGCSGRDGWPSFMVGVRRDGEQPPGLPIRLLQGRLCSVKPALRGEATQLPDGLGPC